MAETISLMVVSCTIQHYSMQLNIVTITDVVLRRQLYVYWFEKIIYTSYKLLWGNDYFTNKIEFGIGIAVKFQMRLQVASVNQNVANQPSIFEEESEILLAWHYKVVKKWQEVFEEMKTIALIKVYFTDNKNPNLYGLKSINGYNISGNP